MKKLFLLCFITTLFCACSKYGSVGLQYPIPALVEMPQSIKSIAVVNRSHSQKLSGNSIAEAIVSGEIAGSDKKASNQCIKAVYDGLNGWRQTNVVVLEKTKLPSTGTHENPEMLDWKIVKRICDSVKTDVLLVLETFDSNTDLLVNAVNTAVGSVIAGTPVTSNLRQVRMNVIAYWRLYEPASKKIIDQYESQSQFLFDGGANVVAVPPPDALPQTAYRAGDEYIQRFIPKYYKVQRQLYKKGKGREKQQFRAAFRKAEVANWEGAIEAWTKLLNSGRSYKNSGRACLNIAVAHEVLGNNSEAKVWAKRAYEDYGNKLARDYQKELNY